MRQLLWPQACSMELHRSIEMTASAARCIILAVAMVCSADAAEVVCVAEEVRLINEHAHRLQPQSRRTERHCCTQQRDVLGKLPHGEQGEPPQHAER